MNLQLRALREAHGLTPRQMYERLGVQDSRYRKWESETSQIPIDYAIMCCDILHCSLDELAGRRHVAMTADERELLGCAWARFGEHPFRNLRNSWETWMRWEVGVAPWAIEVAMGHKLGGVTGRYYDRPTDEVVAAVFADAYRSRPWD